MKVESVVFQQPRLNENLSPAELDKMGSPRQQLPAGADALAEFDCIILGDVGVEQLPLAERKRLEKYVAERGGTLGDPGRQAFHAAGVSGDRGQWRGRSAPQTAADRVAAHRRAGRRLSR